LSSAESKRKHALLSTFLLTLTLIGAGFTVWLYGEWSAAYSQLVETKTESDIMEYLLGEVNATAPRVTITLTFTPVPAEKQMLPNAVTFLTGYLTATNLTDLYYPCIMEVLYNVTYSSTNPNGTVEFTYIPYQAVYLLKGIERVEVPFGIFPLSIYNFHVGDTIRLFATATVIVRWEPVGAIMTYQAVATTFTVNVVG